jgi:hypothetical protein
MIAGRITLRGQGKMQQRGKAMCLPQAANIGDGLGQDIKCMGAGVERAMPILRRAGDWLGAGQEGASRGMHCRQGAMRDAEGEPEPIPGEKRHGAWPEP